MKKYPSQTSRQGDEDEDDDRKPPARKSFEIPQLTQRRKQSQSQSQSSNNDENHNANNNDDEQHSESGACSYTSSTAVASIDHSTFHEISAITASSKHRNENGRATQSPSSSSYWWNNLSPFRSSKQSERVQQQRQHHNNHHTSEDDYIYRTPTNTSMINAIRNEMSHERTSGSGSIPNLTFATPYTPDNHSIHQNHTERKFTAKPASRPTNYSQPSTTATAATTTSESAITVGAGVGGTATLSRQYHSTTSTDAPPTSPVEHITNTTILTIQRNTILYVASTMIAWIVLFSYILPSVVLYTLLWIMISTALMIQTFYTTIQEYYYHIVVMGPGLGSMVLPQSIYNLLTQESLHEFLTDEVLVLEYRHLLLYFLPISSQQLRDLLRRIAPQHQQRLQRRGEIGTLLFGENVMRVILGHTQYEQWRNRRSSSPSSSPSSSISISSPSIQLLNDANNGGIPRQVVSQSSIQQPLERNDTLLLENRLDDDDDDEHSDLGLDISSDDMIGGNVTLARRLGLMTATRTPIPSVIVNNRNNLSPLSSRINNPQPLPHEVITTTSSSNNVGAASNINTAAVNNDAVRATTYDDQEYQVLMEALWDAFYGAVYNPINEYVTTTYMIPTLRRISQVTFHTGIVMMSISTGNLLGFWGWSYHLLYNSIGLYLPTRSLLSSTEQQSQRSSIADVSPSRPGVVAEPFHGVSSLRLFGSFDRPSPTTWSTALLGSASLGISYYSRQYVRRYYTTTSTAATNINTTTQSSNGATPSSNNPSKLISPRSLLPKKE